MARLFFAHACLSFGIAPPGDAQWRAAWAAYQTADARERRGRLLALHLAVAFADAALAEAGRSSRRRLWRTAEACRELAAACRRKGLHGAALLYEREARILEGLR